MPVQPNLPTGTVTFLFTDIEGSTRLLHALGEEAYGPLLGEHRRLLTEPIAREGGSVFGTEGDAVFAVFPTAAGAIQAAVDGQRGLAGHAWPPGAEIRVRMGIHTGEGRPMGDNYIGLDLHRVARIAAAGHGGQVLVSSTTYALLGGNLPAGVTTRDMGDRHLKDLPQPERIQQLVIDGLRADFPELKTLDVVANNLPPQLTSFVGRAREVAEARRLLDNTHLLTLTGPGGTGKTRLGLAVAAEVASDYPDGVFFVPLDAVVDPSLVASQIVGALGLAESAQQPPATRLLEHLRDRRVLLVLDNFEQVADAAPLVADILRGSRGTRILVTSRAPLRISGEQEFPVPPLGLPDPSRERVSAQTLAQYEGVALFMERALAVRPDFELTDENAPAIAEICLRLDGLPLAIELAAARVRHLTPQAILARLGQRLALLSGGSRDMPERQQTLRGAIAWSYDLLEPPFQRVLARCGTFAGGLRLDEAEPVCGSIADVGVDVLDGLSTLVDQSLLRQTEAAGEPRYRMLQTIREFAIEQLEASDDAAAIRDRHLATFLKLAEQAADQLAGAERRHVLDRLDIELDNLRAAFAWAIATGQTEPATRLLAALWRFWHMRSHLAEGWDRAREVLALPQTTSAMRRTALDAGAGVAYWRGDFEAAAPLYLESLELANQEGDPQAIAEGAYNLSFIYSVNRSDMGRALGYGEAGLTTFRAIGDEAGIAKSLWTVGQIHYFQNAFETALPMLREAVERMRALNDRFGLGWCLHTLGLAELRLGQVVPARDHFSEAMRIFAEADDRSGIGLELANFRALALRDGDILRAERLGGAADALVTTSGMQLAALVDEIEGRVKEIPAGEAAAARAAGAAMSLAEAVGYALEPVQVAAT